MELALWQWVLAGLCALLIGISKTGIGGVGMFGIVLFANVLPARESVGVVLVLLIVSDIVAILVYRRDADWRQLLRIFPWSAAGVILGAIAAGVLPAGPMRVLIGLIIIALTVAQMVRSRTPAGEPAALPRWLSSTAGLAAGFTTMVANAGGPLMTIYLLAQRLPKITFVGTTAWYFFCMNLFKLPFSLQLGIVSAQTFRVSAGLMPFAILGALLGKRLVTSIDQALFERIALVLTLIAGVRLLF